MNKSTLRERAKQRQPLPADLATLELNPGESGAWQICAVHAPTGKRVVMTIAAPNGDTALAIARMKAADLDPFADQSAWQFAAEFLDFDAVVAMQVYDTVDMDEPIPFTATPQLAQQDLELYAQVDDGPDDLFWPERARELRR